MLSQQAFVLLNYPRTYVYLLAVCYAHISSGKHSIFLNQLTSRLYQLIKGICKVQFVNQAPRIRQPITFETMEGIQSLLSRQLRGYYNLMIWAALPFRAIKSQ